MRARLQQFDLALYRRIRCAAKDPDTIDRIRQFSALGEHGAVWLAIGAGGVLVDGRRRDRWVRATSSIAGAYAVSTAIKMVIRRSRPEIEDLPKLMKTPTGLSFPSSHAASSFAAARAFGPLLPSVPLYPAAIAMSMSRLYLGVHYPSDVVVGAALGTAIGSLGR